MPLLGKLRKQREHMPCNVDTFLHSKTIISFLRQTMWYSSKIIRCAYFLVQPPLKFLFLTPLTVQVVSVYYCSHLFMWRIHNQQYQEHIRLGSNIFVKFTFSYWAGIYSLPIYIHCQNTDCQLSNWQITNCQKYNCRYTDCQKYQLPKYWLPKHWLPRYRLPKYSSAQKGLVRLSSVGKVF